MMPSGVSLTSFIGQPVAMMPSALEALLLRAKDLPRFDEARGPADAVAETPQPFASRFVGRYDRETRCNVTDDGVAVLPVHGTLINRGAWLGSFWGYTTYEGLAEQMKRLASDPGVKSVLLDINSGGGEVAGLWDLMPVLGALKQAKPVTAIANACAASAAYAIGCAAHQIYVARSGMAGSIGVVSVHMSYAEAMQRYGVKPTLIQAGRYKTLGNRYQDLDAESLGLLQASCDSAYDQFVAHVASARGLEPSHIRATEARVFKGQEAVDAEIVDGVASFEEALDLIRSRPTARRRASNSGVTYMQTATGSASRAELSDSIAQALAQIGARTLTGSLPAVQATAPAAQPATDMVSKAEAERLAKEAAETATKAERARVASITSSEVAKGREAAALKMALTTSLSVEEAASVLAELPKVEAAKPETATAPANPLHAEMAKRGNAAGVPAQAAAAGSDQNALADRAVAYMTKTFGRKSK